MRGAQQQSGKRGNLNVRMELDVSSWKAAHSPLVKTPASRTDKMIAEAPPWRIPLRLPLQAPDEPTRTFNSISA